MNIVDVKNILHDDCVLSVVALSQYMPTKEKMNNLANLFKSDTDVFAFACNDNGFVKGVIILKRIGHGKFEIISIATDPAHRNQGIASKLISFAVYSLKCSEIKAVTDADAVDFYHKYGFDIESLGEIYPGTIRYLCTLKLS